MSKILGNVNIVANGSGATNALLVEDIGGIDLLTLREDGITTIGTVTSGAFKLNVENNLYVKSTSGNAEIEISADAVGQAFLQINNQNTNLDSYLHFANTGVNKVSMGWDDSADSFKMGTLSIATSTWYENNTTTNVARHTNSLGIGLVTPSSTQRFVVRGGGSTNATTTLLVENSSGNDLLKINDDGGVVFNDNNISGADFTIEGTADPSLFKTNSSDNSIGIGIAGNSTSKLYVDATNETRTYIATFASNTAQNGILINTSATNADVFGIQSSIATNNASGIARGIYANSTGGNGRDNYALYARSGNASRDNIAVFGQQVFAGGTGINAGVYGLDSSPNTVVKHGVYGTVNTGTDGVTTTGYAVRGLAGLGADDAINYALHGRISITASATGATGYGLFIENGSAVGAGSIVYGLVVEDGSEYSGFGTITPTDTLHVDGTTGSTQFRLEQSYTPTGSGDTAGNIGSVAWDDNYWYQKTNTGWGRVVWDYGF